MLNYIKIDEEILYTTDPVTKIDQADIAVLKQKAGTNRRRRIRLCAHLDVEDALHEMLIVHHRGNYVPPHKHLGKSESFHIIEGALRIVLFCDEGEILDIIRLDSSGSEGSYFYYRLSESLYHTVIPLSDIVVFHETTNGPFRREDMIIPEWAANDSVGEEMTNSYLSRLNQMICRWQINGSSENENE